MITLSRGGWVLSETASVRKRGTFLPFRYIKEREFYWFKCMKGKGNLPFRSVKGPKRANSTGFVNHLHSKCSEFTVVKREANFTTRHVKGVPFVERRNTPSV